MPIPTEWQFLFLFRRQRSLADCEIVEPVELPQNEENIPEVPPLTDAIGYPEAKPEEQRRLFRYNIPATRQSEDLAALLAHAWGQVSAQYARCEVRVPGQAPQYANHSERLLYCVALVMVGDPPAERLCLPMRETEDAPVVGECSYQVDDETPLFRVAPCAQPDRAATCYAYTPHPKPTQVAVNLAKINHWQLQLHGDNAPCLVELQCGEDQNHPVFCVFGVDAPSHADSLDPALRELTVFDTTNRGYSPLMLLLSPLLMKAWQYGHIETAARRLDGELRREMHRYKDYTDSALRVRARELLEHDLQAMQALEARANYEQGRIAQALRTLEINQNNLLENQHLLTEVLSDTWHFDWLWYDQPLMALRCQHQQTGPSPDARPAMVKSFSYPMEDLRNLQTYLQGKLTHLKGSSERWRIALEQQRLELYEKLGHIGHAIILLVALAEMGHVLHNAASTYAPNHAADHAYGGNWWQILLDGLNWLDTSPPIHFIATVLQSPTLFLCLVLLILWPAVHAWGRYTWHRHREHRHHRRALRDKPKSNDVS